MTEGVDYDTVKWMTAGSQTIGFVVKTDKITGEKFLYVAAVNGRNEEQDIKYILEWGTKLRKETVLGLLT